MLLKSYSKTGQVCRATFKLPVEIEAQSAAIAGEFNNWEPEEMKRLKDGSFSITVSLDADKAYRFRYLLDGERWENDWAADAYWPNSYGADDSVIKV